MGGLWEGCREGFSVGLSEVLANHLRTQEGKAVLSSDLLTWTGNILADITDVAQTLLSSEASGVLQRFALRCRRLWTCWAADKPLQYPVEVGERTRGVADQAEVPILKKGDWKVCSS